MALQKTSSLELISEFLAHKRLAIVGVSRESADFTRSIYNEFRNRGYDVAPVNPAAESINGAECFARVQDVRPYVGAVLIMTPPKVTEQVVRDCADAEIKLVWMHKGVGAGSVSEAAIAFCQENGIRVIAGHCPLMFFENAGFIHNFHGAIKKLTGSYPN